MTANANPAIIYDCFKGWVTLEDAAKHCGLSVRGVLYCVDTHRDVVKTVRIGKRLTLVYLPSLDECRQTIKYRKQPPVSYSTP